MSDSPPNRRLGYVLKQVQHALRREMDEQLDDVDLTTPQYAALTAVERDSGLSNAELARRCFVTPQTMHRIVERLEDRELLERTPDPDHGRIQQIRLTDAGRERLADAHQIVDAIEERMTRPLEDDEVEQARDLLERCREGLMNG